MSLEFRRVLDRKSTRLNSSHTIISYAVFCLKKKISLLLTLPPPSPTPPCHQSPATSPRASVQLGATSSSAGGHGTQGGRYGCFFFFNKTATPEIYTLSLHGALPIWFLPHKTDKGTFGNTWPVVLAENEEALDRKSTRLHSSHTIISYAVFCLKKTGSRREVSRESRCRPRRCSSPRRSPRGG